MGRCFQIGMLFFYVCVVFREGPDARISGWDFFFSLFLVKLAMDYVGCNQAEELGFSL